MNCHNRPAKNNHRERNVFKFFVCRRPQSRKISDSLMKKHISCSFIANFFSLFFHMTGKIATTVHLHIIVSIFIELKPKGYSTSKEMFGFSVMFLLSYAVLMSNENCGPCSLSLWFFSNNRTVNV